jgi:hypothetical protein
MGFRRKTERSSGLSRRQLLAGGAAGLAGGALAGPLKAVAQVAPAGDPGGSSLNGTLKAVKPGTLVFADYHLDLDGAPAGAQPPSGAEAVLPVSEDAPLWRSGPAELGDFRPGDKLIAYVEWRDGSLVALAVEPLYEGVQATVSSRKDDRLSTDAGNVVLTEHTLMVATAKAPAAKSHAGIAKGNKIFATCRVDPDSGDYVANNVGVV